MVCSTSHSGLDAEVFDAFRSLLWTVIRMCNYRLTGVEMTWSRALHKLQGKKILSNP